MSFLTNKQQHKGNVNTGRLRAKLQTIKNHLRYLRRTMYLEKIAGKKKMPAHVSDSKYLRIPRWFSTIRHCFLDIQMFFSSAVFLLNLHSNNFQKQKTCTEEASAHINTKCTLLRSECVCVCFCVCKCLCGVGSTLLPLGAQPEVRKQ